MTELVVNTMRVFEVVSQVAPDPAFPAEVGQILGVSESDCSAILESLWAGGWLRKTSEGFQTIGQRVFRLTSGDYRLLDQTFRDRGERVPQVFSTL